jgi:GNAT superfamily N-acetyltransferase
MQMIKELLPDHCASILDVINDAASAYKGVIPFDRWKEPYMSANELADEIRTGVRFYGWFENGFLLGITGIQNVGDIDLIRHCYVRTGYRRRSIGGALLQHLLSLAHTSLILVGTGKTHRGQFGLIHVGFALRSQRQIGTLKLVALKWAVRSEAVK